MELILEYVMSHYVWFLGGAIVIFLAIIGYFADKTNFGQGKNKEQQTEKNNEKEISTFIEENKNQSFQDLIDTKQESQIEKDFIEQTEPIDEQIDSQELNSNLENTQVPKQQIVDDENVATDSDSKFEVEKQVSFEKSFEEFDKEFNEILPKKEIIDDELLDDIENLSLDKTQKIDLIDIPDLDDVELPKIKNLEPESEDVWKF